MAAKFKNTKHVLEGVGEDSQINDLKALENGEYFCGRRKITISSKVSFSYHLRRVALQ